MYQILSRSLIHHDALHFQTLKMYIRIYERMYVDIYEPVWQIPIYIQMYVYIYICIWKLTLHKFFLGVT